MNIIVDNTGNKEIKELMCEVTRVADLLSEKFNLPLRKIKFIRHGLLYGSCDRGEGEIKIKLMWADDERVPEMEVWRTLAHELTHFLVSGHPPDFWTKNRDMVLAMNELTGMKIRPEMAMIADRVKGLKVIQ